VGEKLPYDSLASVRKQMIAMKLPRTGVYVAHDSMGFARYIGRGSIFGRLRSHRRAHPLELMYFSFFVVEDKIHEGEIETILIRASSPLLEFNSQKKRVGTRAGNIRDFEAGTAFFQRQYHRGKRKPGKRKRGRRKVGTRRPHSRSAGKRRSHRRAA
jgi:hypothetical protein